MTVTHRGTRIHDLANGLPCSNQLSYPSSHSIKGTLVKGGAYHEVYEVTAQ